MTLSPEEKIAWQDLLEAGDIVSFAFPVSEPGDCSPRKARPCLVLEIVEMSGVRCAHLAYGTSIWSRANRGLELRVSRKDDIDATGLVKPTRFVGARRLLIPLDDDGFRCRNGSPVIGKLPEELQPRLQAITDSIHGTKDVKTLRNPSHKPVPSLIKPRPKLIKPKQPKLILPPRLRL